MFMRLVLASVFAAGTAAAQFMGGAPIGAFHSSSASAGSSTNYSAPPIAAIPPGGFGTTIQPGISAGYDFIYGTGVGRFPTTGFPNVAPPVHPLKPDTGYAFPYVQSRQYTPIESTNNLVRRAPSAGLPAALLPPNTPNTREWSVLRSNYAYAAIRVSAARQFVDERRAREEEQGLTPDANLLATTTDAEKALQSAREAMSAQNIDDSRTEIRQAIGLSDVVLKEFGH